MNRSRKPGGKERCVIYRADIGPLLPVNMMNTRHLKTSHFSCLLRDRSGNFGIMTAIMIPVLIGAAGMAIDVSNMALSQRQIQEATDSAALAAATALANGKVANTTEAEDLAKDFVSGQMSNYFAGDTAASDAIKNGTEVGITETSVGATGKQFAVTVTSSFPLTLTPFMSVFGYKTVTVAAKSSTTSATDIKNALSMYLVLDRSGSMLFQTEQNDPNQTSCKYYYEKDGGVAQSKTSVNPCKLQKIAALKQAVNDLMGQIAKADPNQTYSRTAVVSFNSTADTNPVPFNWGTSGVLSFINNTNKFAANGGTNSAGAMTTAYNALTNTSATTSEEAIHKAKTGLTPTKYIVFMTDGENTGGYVTDSKGNYVYLSPNQIDQSTLTTCTNAKAKGIQVYTVAFMAPQRGQNLLKSCATSTSTYFQAESMADLVSAFKAIGEKATQGKTLLTN